jgi:dTMP kinase
MFITFEGIDGCGKSTQLELVEKFLIDNGKEVLTLREPGGTVFAEEIREILLHSHHTISKESELFLFEAARADLVSKVIKPALEQGIIVLCDRFYDSTTTYQGYGRGFDIQTIKIINNLATNGLKPDLTFFLNVSLETSQQRVANKLKDKIENSGDGFFKKIIDAYKILATEEPDRFVEINSEGNIQNTYEKIIEIIRKKLLINY